MMLACTTLDQTVNQIKLVCLSGFLDAMRRNTPVPPRPAGWREDPASLGNRPGVVKELFATCRCSTTR